MHQTEYLSEFVKGVVHSFFYVSRVKQKLYYFYRRRTNDYCQRQCCPISCSISFQGNRTLRLLCAAPCNTAKAEQAGTQFPPGTHYNCLYWQRSVSLFGMMCTIWKKIDGMVKCENIIKILNLQKVRKSFLFAVAKRSVKAIPSAFVRWWRVSKRQCQILRGLPNLQKRHICIQCKHNFNPLFGKGLVIYDLRSKKKKKLISWRLASDFDYVLWLTGPQEWQICPA